MRKILNECVGCDLPCIECGNKHVLRIYCDCCGEEIEYGYGRYKGYEYDGEELCEDCARDRLIKNYLWDKESVRKRLIDGGVLNYEMMAEWDYEEIKEVLNEVGIPYLAEVYKVKLSDISEEEY